MTNRVFKLKYYNQLLNMFSIQKASRKETMLFTYLPK